MIDSSVKGKILFFNHGSRQGRDIPMVEVKVDSAATALTLRRGFVAKKKPGGDFGKLHVANSVTMSTRVRTDIMRGIAPQYSVEGKLDMFVAAYYSRPVIHIKEGTDRGQTKSYALTFTDAIAKYGKTLREEFLLDAYKKVGMAFKGHLEQHFVVLKDLDVERMLVTANESGKSKQGSR